ncbi:Cysteine proteinases superfamily protein [Raphanus sativus]|nr:Cysteine proteinases superfamily protein [Raphanus sativus]
METGGNRRSGKDDRGKENEKNSKGKRVKVSEEGNDCPSSWDWRNYKGVISNVLQQHHHFICWAISFIRAVEALYNIGQRVDEQRSYLVNNVKVGKLGLEDRKTLGDFVQKNGLLDEAECSYKRAKGTCAHENPNIERIDRLAIINQVDDADLARLVWRHPVVGVLPMWPDFDEHREGIYRPRERAGINQLHAVLIVGFGVDNNGSYYWIIQNSAGRGWGEGGFGLIHREHRRGRPSLFVEVFYPEKRGYPRKK